MKTEADIIELVDGVTIAELRIWVSQQWVRPALSEAEPRFSDTDLARIRLLQTLIREFEIGGEAIPIILSLIDQVHDLRAQMSRLAGAIDAHPEDIGSQLIQLIDEMP